MPAWLDHLEELRFFLIKKTVIFKDETQCWEAVWPSGQSVGFEIRRSRVQIPFGPLADVVCGSPKFNFQATLTLVNSQLGTVASCQLGFLTQLCLFEYMCNKVANAIKQCLFEY